MSADFPATGGPPEIRASDADRDHVVDVLRVAMGDGRLTGRMRYGSVEVRA
jgi:hypothetical protein